ncbi:MAG: hypothetical protein HOE61_09710 [Candidatus Marinimicrobia bacterium]|jgi:hypothetical protein|nr:hypothetical protein [Candidatus Neomarinimicrobiota bacterium]
MAKNPTDYLLETIEEADIFSVADMVNPRLLRLVTLGTVSAWRKIEEKTSPDACKKILLKAIDILENDTSDYAAHEHIPRTGLTERLESGKELLGKALASNNHEALRELSEWVDNNQDICSFKGYYKPILTPRDKEGLRARLDHFDFPDSGRVHEIVTDTALQKEQESRANELSEMLENLYSDLLKDTLENSFEDVYRSLHSIQFRCEHFPGEHSDYLCSISSNIDRMVEVLNIRTEPLPTKITGEDILRMDDIMLLQLKSMLSKVEVYNATPRAKNEVFGGNLSLYAKQTTGKPLYTAIAKLTSEVFELSNIEARNISSWAMTSENRLQSEELRIKRSLMK